MVGIVIVLILCDINHLPGTQVAYADLLRTIGQVLAKSSSDSFDYKWISPAIADLNYTQDFTVTDTVTVNHNLNKFPSVSVIDSRNLPHPFVTFIHGNIGCSAISGNDKPFFCNLYAHQISR